MSRRDGEDPPGSPENESVEQEMPEIIRQFLAEHPDAPRKAWIGSVDDVTPSNPRLASKFGGVKPYMPAGKVWPVCEACEDKKTFVCQINIRQVPKEIQSHIGLDSGLFQLFYCFECSEFDGVFKDVEIIPEKELCVPGLKVLAAEKAARSTNLKAKNIPGSVKKFINEMKVAEDENEYPERFVKWEVAGYKEIMNSEELSDVITQDMSDAYDELDEFYDADGMTRGPYGGVKLGGYVCWVQGVEYPECPDCKVDMKTTFLQISEEELFSNSWGDCGVAHVTLCPRCKRPGLGWACG